MGTPRWLTSSITDLPSWFFHTITEPSASHVAILSSRLFHRTMVTCGEGKGQGQPVLQRTATHTAEHICRARWRKEAYVLRVLPEIKIPPHVLSAQFLVTAALPLLPQLLCEGYPYHAVRVAHSQPSSASVPSPRETVDGRVHGHRRSSLQRRVHHKCNRLRLSARELPNTHIQTTGADLGS